MPRLTSEVLQIGAVGVLEKSYELKADHAHDLRDTLGDAHLGVEEDMDARGGNKRREPGALERRDGQGPGDEGEEGGQQAGVGQRKVVWRVRRCRRRHTTAAATAAAATAATAAKALAVVGHNDVGGVLDVSRSLVYAGARKGKTLWHEKRLGKKGNEIKEER